MSGRRWWARDERGAAAARAAATRSPPITIDLARRCWAAGEAVVALVDGVGGPARVTLVRVERRPCGESAVVLDEQRLADPYGVVEL
ncbi:MAG TPA: hypothetical protein VNT55_00595, partial [Baekduia sp.]|nr:hypothetical protein [Baekduia sp.]